MAERSLPAQTKKSTAPDNRIRIGIGQADGSVLVQGALIRAGFLGGIPFDAGQSVAIVRQDKTWLVLGVVYADFTPAIHYQAGYVDITVAAATTGTAAVVFARPFAAVPAVATTISTNLAATSGWGSRAFNITVSGFSILLFGASASFTAPVSWQAQAVTQ